jgi:hypothetical protein
MKTNGGVNEWRGQQQTRTAGQDISTLTLATNARWWGSFFFFSCFLFFISYLHRCERLLAGCKSIDFF